MGPMGPSFPAEGAAAFAAQSADRVSPLGCAMIEPPLPVDEADRLGTLRSLNILDTQPEERFDRLTRMARRMFGVPIALISLVDENRQWFKSCQGLGVSETPRSISFCGHAILGDETLIVPDALADERFHGNPLVSGEPKIRFYAGCPLWVNGRKLGTLCLIDQQPRGFDSDDRGLLRDLARMAEQEVAAVELATMDELTQLSNRRGFLALGQHALGLCARLQRPASLFYFDLDGFKSINDRFGHAEGDRALVAFSSLLMQTFRDSDVVGRLGGDEFVVLVTNCAEHECGHALQRLDQAVQQHNRQRVLCCDIDFSVGSVAFDGSRQRTIQALLEEADALMYERKRRKKVA
jgi:diguanylate cyclase (GGDEF)-like protein